jgi:hypothetical protein
MIEGSRQHSFRVPSMPGTWLDGRGSLLCFLCDRSSYGNVPLTVGDTWSAQDDTHVVLEHSGPAIRSRRIVR